MGGVPPPPPHLQAPTAADPGRGEGPRESDPQLLPPKASMFTPLSALLRHGDLSGDRAFSKTPLSCPTVCSGLSPPGFLGEEEGKDRMLFGGNSRDFFFLFLFREGDGEASYLGGGYQSIHSVWTGLRVFWLVGLLRYLCAPDVGVGALSFRSARVLFLSS